MNKKLYKLMNWAAIEEIIYSECAHPQNLLGPHTVGNSTLIQAYFPGATSASIKWLSSNPEIGDVVTSMEVADEDGYFAVLLPEKKVSTYTYNVNYETKNDDNTIDVKNVILSDPYRHTGIISKDDILSFQSGNNFALNNILGAREMMHGNEKGVHFAVWAPNAMRVSVVGEFNNWDGRIHQMEKIDGGIFEIFIPGELAGKKYQYEIKLKGDRIIKKNDVFSACLIDNVSVVPSSVSFKWTDKDYMSLNKKSGNNPLIYEIDDTYFEGNAKNFKKKLNTLIKNVKSQGYNYVQLGVQDTTGLNCDGFYIINKAFSDSENVKTIVNEFHKENIGVLFGWTVSGFSLVPSGMSMYDGTCLYEHMDSRQGLSADGTRALFQYGRPEVISFLISNGLSWIKDYHADGLCLNGVAQMLYLDYGKTEGNWIPNSLGGNENLEAISFMQTFIQNVNELYPDVMIIAEDSSTRGGMTVPQNDGGMGFDYKWNEGFLGEFFDYMSYDPIQRSNHHTLLTNEYVYSFTEKYIIPISKQIVNDDVYNCFAGNDLLKKNSLKATLAYAYAHPGIKLINSNLDKDNAKLCLALNRLYANEPALSDTNNNPEGFEWLSNMNYNGCYVSYSKKTDDPEDMLIVVANFAGIDQQITTGVPYEGKYHEILNTDSVEYGGKNLVNAEELRATDIAADGRPQSITLDVAACSVCILKFEPYTETELAKVIEERIRRNTPIKKTKKDEK